MCATDFTAEFRETSNGRFDALLHKDNTLKSVVAAMRGLAALQRKRWAGATCPCWPYGALTWRPLRSWKN